jgi:hypothetical protein
VPTYPAVGDDASSLVDAVRAHRADGIGRVTAPAAPIT